MSSSEILAFSSFFEKFAALVAIPVHTTNKIWAWILQQHKQWLLSKQDKTVITQEFNIDLRDLPASYGINAKKDKLLLELIFLRMAEISSYASFGYPENQENRCKISVTVESPKENINKITLANEILDSVSHEMRHYVQFLIGRSVNTDIIVPSGYSYDEYVSSHLQRRDKKKQNTTKPEFAIQLDKSEKTGPGDDYWLDDLELQTLISSSFFSYLRNHPKSWKNINNLKIWVNNTPSGKETDELLVDKFFVVLSEKDPEKWRYAVREFYKLFDATRRSKDHQGFMRALYQLDRQ